MLQITKKIDYALNLLLTVAAQNSDKPLTLARISEAKNLPKSFLARVATKLTKAGILKSKEGVAGGYFLAKSPQKISVADVISALRENKNNYQNCAECSCEFCTKRDIEKPLVEKISKTLQNKTLSDFLKI